jgi:hypothetical protein
MRQCSIWDWQHFKIYPNELWATDTEPEFAILIVKPIFAILVFFYQSEANSVDGICYFEARYFAGNRD